MERLQGYRFKARPSAAQAMLFSRTAGVCRAVYNAALEQRQFAWNQQRVSVRYKTQAGELKELKAAFPWVAEAPHHCLQQALRDLEVAYTRFFDGLAGYPRFRKKGESDSFRFPDPKQIRLLPFRGRRGRIRLPKAGELSFVAHRRVEGTLRSVTVSREADGWYISILTSQDVPEPAVSTLPAVGIDLGVAATATLSSGERFSVPDATPGEKQRLLRLQQKLARQKKGSNGRRKTRTAIAKLHQRLRRRRTDALHRISHHLAKSHGLVVVEALKVQNMTRSARGSTDAPGRNVRQKAALNRAILKQGWGELRRQLHYKLPRSGGRYVTVPAINSSRDCHQCGHVDAANRPDQPTFACTSCGHQAHADVNAANVVLARGLRVTAGGAFAQSGGRRNRNLNTAPPQKEPF